MRTQLKKLGRVSTAVVAGLTASVGLVGAAALVASPANAASNVTVNRIAGPNRYDTAAALAETKFPNGVPSGNVVLATGKDFPDALAGNYLAGQLRAAIMLTTPTTTNSAYSGSVVPALAKLLPGSTKNVIILGGGNAVGTDVEGDLTSKGYTVSRIAGAGRYDTAQLVDTQAGQTAANGASGNPTAIVATGEKFADALAAGPLGYAKKFPIILTDGSQSSLSPQAKAALSANKIKNALVMGGSLAVSDGIVADLKANGVTIDKQFAGADRTDTAAQLLTYATATYGFSNGEVILSSGGNFPDALAAGPFGGDPKGILETEPDLSLGSFNTTELKTLGPATIDVTGGSFAVPQATSDAAKAAAQTACGTAVTPLPELICGSIISTTSSQQANATNSAGTVVEFVMSQSMATATFNPAGFKVYPSDDAANAGAGFAANGNGSGICGVTAGVSCPKSSNPNAVRVLFGQTPLQGTTLQDNAGTLTLAAVAFGAVTLTSGALSPAGSVPIGVAGTVTPPSPGVTQGPDLQAFGTPRPANGNNATALGCVAPPAASNCSAIDLTFDKPAFPTANSSYNIVFAAGQVTPAEVLCQGPTSGPTSATGTTEPTFNPSTNTITVVCKNPQTTAGSETVIPPQQIAWMTAQNVSTQASGGVTAFFLATTHPQPAPPGATSPNPALTKVIFTAGTSSSPDRAEFDFDSPVLVSKVNSSQFDLVQQNGAQFRIGTPSSAVPAGPDTPQCSASPPPPTSGNPTCQTDSNATLPSGQPGTTVHVTFLFTSGTVASLVAVGGIALRGAVTSSNGSQPTNFDNEFGAAPTTTNSTGQRPGVINAPQLSSGTFSTSTSQSGVTTGTATDTFDEPVAVASGAPALHWYVGTDGTELTCATGAATPGSGSANNTVTCTSFVQGNTATGTPATPAQLAGVAAATVDNGAVSGNVAAGATDGNQNPEDELRA